MLYISKIKKESGKITAVRGLVFLDRPDIEFEFSVEIIKNAIQEGRQYMTTFFEDNEWKRGAEVEVVDDFLKTNRNKIAKDNLLNLPTY